MIKLYHGTNVAFSTLDPSKSRNGLDFGSGAYLTPDVEQAWGMARRKQMVLGGRRIVMEFDFDDSCLLDPSAGCLNFEAYNEDWTAFVLRNRNRAWNFKHDYPVVSGPVADGVMPTVLEDYLKVFPSEAEALNKENLSRLTKQLLFSRRQSRQYCFHTKEAIEKYLKYIKSYEQ